MGFLKSLFGRTTPKGRARRLVEEDLDLLFLSPDFVKKYLTLPESAKDEFLRNLTQKDLDHYLAQGRAMKKKREIDLGY